MNDDQLYENQLLSSGAGLGLGQNQFGSLEKMKLSNNMPNNGMKNNKMQVKAGISLKQTRLHRESNNSPRRNGFNMFEMADQNDDDIEVV